MQEILALKWTDGWLPMVLDEKGNLSQVLYETPTPDHIFNFYVL